MKTIANKPFPVWFFLFLLLLRPVGLVHILSIESITRLLCEIISILFFIYGVYSRKLTIPNILYIVYTLYLLLCTLFNGTNADITEMLKVAVCNIGIVCFINYIIFKDTYNALKSMYAVYLVLIVLNLLYTLKNPSGYNLHDWNTYRRGYYLFGHQNSTITYVLPAICIALIAFHKNIIKKRQAILIIVFSVASIVMAFSATSLVGLIIFFLVFGLMKMGKLKKILNASCAMLIGSVLCIGVVFFNIQKSGIAANIITRVLHRSTDFTARTLIWEKTLNVIQENWFFGIGYKVNTSYQSLIHASSAHNEYLYMMLQGGVILLAIFYIYFTIMKIPFESNKESHISFVFTALYFSLFIQFIVETHMHRIAPLLALVGCANKIIDDNDNYENDKTSP